MDIFGLDKLYHIGASFMIASFLFSLFVKGARLSERAALLCTLVLFIPISIIKEIADSYEINNHFDLFDICANYVGVMFGIIVCLPSPPLTLTVGDHLQQKSPLP
jgi:VanZ family protein